MIRLIQLVIAASILSPDILHAQTSIPKSEWTFTTTDDDPISRVSNETYGKGLLRPANWRERATYTTVDTTAAVPRKFDWRTVVQGGLTPIRNQGGCGSCWAFASTASFADMLKIKEGQNFDISEQHLVSCDNSSSGCAGGYFSHAIHQKYGWVKESEFPYQASDVSCKQNVNYQDRITRWAHIGSGSRSPTVEEIKQAVYKYGPVAVTIAAVGAFDSYRSGVFNACENSGTNHMVNIVGWNDDEGAWIMRNSWGENWGERGYMRIKYGCNNIAEDATFVAYDGKCPEQPEAVAGTDKTIRAGESIQIGTTIPYFDMEYEWEPAEGLTDLKSANPVVKPTKSTIYSLKVKTSCGTAVSSVRVNVN